MDDRFKNHKPQIRYLKLNYSRLQGEGFEITGRLEVDLTHSRPFVRHSCASRACPALDAGNPCFLDTGSLFSQGQAWIPVFTGMTILVLYCSDAHGRPHSNPVRDM